MTTQPPPDSSPFDLRPEDARAPAAAALCIHGLTGTPYEVRPLAQALAARGIRARGPVLPGHDVSPELLARVPHGAWLEAVLAEYRQLRAQHDRVFVVGLSLGGLLALAVAQEERVDAVVCIGTPLALQQPIPLLVPLVKHLKPMLWKREGSDIRDPVARARHPGFKQMPLASVHEVVLLQRRVRRRLHAIDAPAYIAHGRHDRTANPRDAHVLHRVIGSEVKEVEIFADSAHVVPVDHDGLALSERVARFLSERS